MTRWAKATIHRHPSVDMIGCPRTFFKMDSRMLVPRRQKVFPFQDVISQRNCIVLSVMRNLARRL